jgi:uncharacterized membrane protein YqjE
MSDPAERADGATLRGSLARLAHSLLGLARTRVELATIEFSEERGRVGRQLALLIAGTGCLLFGLLFAAAGVVAYFWDTSYRIAAFAGVVVVFLGAGAVLLWRRAELAQTAPTPFAATLAELDKDRAALARTIKLPPAP